ncbi:DUF2267 domain-containing protein [Tabrizicola sp. YIM 78059]|uniref:DUF2267 domain-containing protein n=1 Tax=Tabrizicola sp. YIM 78059 TaxID=2529861 RepID=UPI0020BDB8A5|nr:DUF2267 domain-containing protein [Tabrizicola sp. YIM 78059]
MSETPIPWSYRQATREWQAFLAHARQAMDLETDNLAYTAVRGVLPAFRRRLTAQQAIDLAQVLPSDLRALFVADWQIEPPVLPGTRADWTTEAMALRPHHSLTPPNCVEATAYALRRSILRAELGRVLATPPPFAAEF